MPTMPRTRATAAKALKSEVTARGAETASDNIAGMGLNSAIGVSSLRDDANLRSESSNWRWLADERNAHGCEIAGRYCVHPKKGFRRGSGGDIVFDFDDALLHSASERRRVDQCGVCNGRKGAKLLNQIAIEREAAARIVAEGFVGRDARHEHVFGAKAGIDMGQRPQTVN